MSGCVLISFCIFRISMSIIEDGFGVMRRLGV